MTSEEDAQRFFILKANFFYLNIFISICLLYFIIFSCPLVRTHGYGKKPLNIILKFEQINFFFFSFAVSQMCLMLINKIQNFHNNVFRFFFLQCFFYKLDCVSSI